MSYWTDWTFEPLVIVPLIVAALIYARGLRNGLRIVGRSRAAQVPRIAAFYTGLLVVFIALESPIDTLNDVSFAVHMGQHLLLIMIAAPLMILGDPAPVFVRGLPLSFRRRILGGLSRQSWAHRLGGALSWLGSPAPAFVLFIGDLYFWHWPYMYDLTLQNAVVHDIEHICFLATGLLFWAQIIEQPGLRSSLSYAQRVVFIIGASAFHSVLGIYLVYAHRLVYPAYAHVAHRPFGLSAMSDQALAGALMWIPVMYLLAIAFAVCFYKALGQDQQDSMPLAHPGMTYDLFPPAARDSAQRPVSLAQLRAGADRTGGR